MSERGNAQPKYPGRPLGERITNPFERDLRALLGRPTPATVQALLGNRASYDTIRQWRCGKQRAARWATEILATELKRRAAELLAYAAPPPSPLGNVHALMAYRAHRAAQKEKARS